MKWYRQHQVSFEKKNLFLRWHKLLNLCGKTINNVHSSLCSKFAIAWMRSLATWAAARLCVNSGASVLRGTRGCITALSQDSSRGYQVLALYLGKLQTFVAVVGLLFRPRHVLNQTACNPHVQTAGLGNRKLWTGKLTSQSLRTMSAT